MLFKNIFNLKGKHKGQTLTEFSIIIVFVGFALVFIAVDLLDGIKINYYNGMIPISKKADIPEQPEPTYPDPPAYEGPIARIEGPTNVRLGETVIFRDVSYSPSGRIEGSSWGDRVLEITFDKEGQHTIVLEVVDGNGQSDKAELIVYVENRKPFAVVTVSPESPTVRNTIEVTGRNSHDEDEHNIAEWEWHMTNPSNQRIKMDWPLEGYEFARNELTAGEYTFELRVKDEYGKWSDRTSKTIHISP